MDRLTMSFRLNITLALNPFIYVWLIGLQGPWVLLKVLHRFLIAAFAPASTLFYPRGNFTIHSYNFMVYQSETPGRPLDGTYIPVYM